MKNYFTTFLSLIFLLTACTLPSTAPVDVPATSTATESIVISTDTPTATLVPPTETFTPTLPPPTSTPTPIPIVESLNATVIADLLSCRYGPGSEYLYLYGLRKGANIQLMGRTDGNSWVMVAGQNKCWVHTKFLEIKGDPQTLKVLYPDGYKLPGSPFYAPTTVLSATRAGVNVTVEWLEAPVNPGDFEDASMFQYIIEVWRCENGQIIFDPLASNEATVTFVDEAGCSIPSYGRVYVQEKHGFAGPAEIPWPAP